MELRSGKKTGAASEAAPSRGDGAGSGGHSRATMEEVMSSLGAAVVDPGKAQYVSKDIKTACPMYIGLGQNGMGFKKWYNTRFLPRVWAPKETEGLRARTKKMLQLKLAARTQLLKSRVRRGALQTPAAQGGQSEDEDEGEQTVVEDEAESTSDQFALDAGTEQLMGQLADTELKTADDQFECLIEYVSEAAQLKAAILEDIVDRKLQGRARLQFFIERMEASTSTVVLQKAIWLSIAREGILEQPEAYAARFMKAAEDCGRTKADINQRFMDTLLEPWSREPDLKVLVPNFRAHHCLHVQDETELHLQAMASTAFAYETMVAQSTVTKMERSGTLVAGQEKPAKAAAKGGTSSSDQPAKADKDDATRLGLPAKKFPSGKTYRACAACHVVRGKTVYHQPRHCPVKASLEAKHEDTGGTALAAAGQHNRGNTSQREFLCWNCDKPGHSWSNCSLPLREHLQQKKKDMMGSTALAAIQDASASSSGNTGLSRQDVAAMIAEAVGKTDGKAPSKGTGLLTVGGLAHQWLPEDSRDEMGCVGGFAFDDAYSSDGSGMGLMTAQQRPTLPLGVPAAWAVTTRRAQGAQQPGQLANVVQPPTANQPASARRQARMRDPDHDEMRALRNRLPTGMINPADHQQPRQAVSTTDEIDDHGRMTMRVAQLVSLLRTCLSHTRFSALPTELVCEVGEESAAAWDRARAAALAGRQHDGQDPRSVAWHSAIQKAVAVFLAQSQLTWEDFVRIDMRAVFKEAVTAVYGEGAAREMVGAVFQATTQALTTDGAAQHTSQPKEQADALEQHRQKRAAWQQAVKWEDRRPVAVIDGRKAGVTVAGVPVRTVVLDAGANEPMIHETVRAKLDLPLQQEGKSIIPITGKATVMPRTQSTVEIKFYSGDAERESLAAGQCVVMTGSHLPDLLLDNETMAQLGLTIDPVAWTATYPSKPYLPLSAPVVIPLARPSRKRMATLAQMNGPEWPACCVDQEDSEDDEDGEGGVCDLCSPGLCFMVSTSPEGANLGSQVGGGKPRDHPQTSTFSSPERPPQLAPTFSSFPAVRGQHTPKGLVPQPAQAVTDSAAYYSQIWGGDQTTASPFPPSMPYFEVYTTLFAELTAPEEDEGDGLVLASGKVQRNFSQSDLDAIPALPHTAVDKLYVLDTETLQGKRYGGMSGLYLCASVLTSLVTDVCEGIHFRRVRILERDPKRRHQGQRVLNQLHQHFPERLPQRAIYRAFEWAEAIDHDGYNLDGTALFTEFGADCDLLVHIEAGCQGHSTLGPKSGFNHPESGGLVQISAALTDLQYILARKRGFRDWADAPAQFGYLMENVPGPHREASHSKETRMAAHFMDRVYGRHYLHNPALCGDLTSRTAKWWSNMFTRQFYELHEPLFRQAPYTNLSKLVRDLTGGRLQPQVVRDARTAVGGLNKHGEQMEVLPKFVSRPSTVSQRLRSDGTPGAGMLQVVGTHPPQFVPCPVSVRIKALRFWPPHLECLKATTTETDMIRIVGNVCAPTSARVMIRMAVGYAASVHNISSIPVSAQGEPSRPEDETRAAMQRAMDRAASKELSAVEAIDRQFQEARKREHQAEKGSSQVRPTKPRTVAMALTVASRKKFRADALVRHKAAEQAAAARRRAARSMERAKAEYKARGQHMDQGTGPLRSSSINKNVISAVITLLLCAAMWGPAAYRAGLSAGSRVGMAAEAGFYLSGELLIDEGDGAGGWAATPPIQESQHGQMDFADRNATAMDERYRQEAGAGHCLYQLANQRADGKAEEICKVPSQLKSAKDGTPHEWQIGDSFQQKQEFVSMLDRHPEWYAWGLKDLRAVRGFEYSISLSDSRPVFAKQYHLAHRESEFAENWVKELEEAGMVREVESPYAAPVVVAPKKDESGQWTDLRYAIDY